jgi:hypothetical protein
MQGGGYEDLLLLPMQKYTQKNERFEKKKQDF